VQVIAIDGVSRAGKTTIARLLADHLDCECLETGALYRAVALEAVNKRVDAADEVSVSELARSLSVQVADGEVSIDGIEVTERLRDPAVNESVSIVAQHPQVRDIVTKLTRDWAQGHEICVIEGRDIGTNVFPDATLCVFLMANAQERAERSRQQQPEIAHEAHLKSIQTRDKNDIERAYNPLKPADTAIVIDTTDTPPAEVVSEILAELASRTVR
jgi:cytidylate kinase